MSGFETSRYQESHEQPGKFVYHWVPSRIVGNELMPLNILKGKDEDAYKYAVGKYEGREHIMRRTIPGLEAAWNDVLHLSPIHPSELKNAYVEAGGNPDNFPSVWYKIPVSLISPDATSIMRDDNFSAFNADTLVSEAHLPEATREYYKEEISSGRKPLLFYRAPHILYKGTLPLAECSEITI